MRTYCAPAAISAASCRRRWMSDRAEEMTVDEFLLWAEGKEGRWELHDGVPKR